MMTWRQPLRQQLVGQQFTEGSSLPLKALRADRPDLHRWDTQLLAERPGTSARLAT
jgi:hypothetical protein